MIDWCPYRCNDGSESATIIRYIAAVLAGCGVGGKAIQVAYCGIKALEWG